MHEIILITVSGENRPQVLPVITAALAEHEVRILDIGQAVIHNTLSLGIIVEMSHKTDATGSEPLIAALQEQLRTACQSGIHLACCPVSAAAHEQWVAQQGQPRFIVTLLAREITGQHLARVCAVIRDHDLVLEGMTRLSGYPALKDRSPVSRSCVECAVRGIPESITGLRAEFMEISRTSGVDISFQQDNMYRRTRRLLAFDMDSTLIQTEVIDELARRAGVFDEVSSITRAAMGGEMDFSTSLKQRVALLKGLDVAVLEELAVALPVTEGAQRLIETVKKLGYIVVIISGGFTYFARQLQDKLAIDHVYANELEIAQGRLTGRVTGTIVDAQGKAAILQQVAWEKGLNLQQTVAIGDGANDLPMLGIAGLGIAFHAKPVVQQGSKQAISTLGLDGVLYLLGLRDSDMDL